MTSPLTTFFSTLLYTTYKFYVAVVCPEIDHRRQNMVRTSVTYNYASYANFWFLTNMTSSVSYYGIYAQQHGIYLLNNTKRKLISYKFIFFLWGNKKRGTRLKFGRLKSNIVKYSKIFFITTLVVFSLKWNKVLRLFIRVKGGMHTYLEKYILN